MLGSEGREDVDTWLALSPWEMYVLTDLALKLTTNQCPSITQDVTDLFTKELSAAFKQAPRSETQNEQFLPAYSRLTACLGYLEEKKEGTLSQTRQQEIEKIEQLAAGLEEKSSEFDWTPTESYEQPQNPDGNNKKLKDDVAAGYLDKLVKSLQSAIGHVIDTFFQRGKYQEEIDEKRRVQEELKQASNRKLELSYKRSRQNFANFFHEVSKVIQRVCPKIHRPDKNFLREALLDAATWATLDKHDAIITANRYFQNHKLMMKIMECNVSKKK